MACGMLVAEGAAAALAVAQPRLARPRAAPARCALRGAAPAPAGRVSLRTRTRRAALEVEVEVESSAAAASTSEGDWTLPTPSADEQSATRVQLKRRLLELAAVTSRGQAADFTQRVDVEDICMQLEAMNPSADASATLDGSWRLAYASVEAFRSSPFFWAFQAGVGSEDTAAAIFKFTAGLPVAGTRGPFGAITQRFDLPPGATTGRLVSEVAMTIFDPVFGLLPGVSGTVVTEARLRRDQADDATLLRVTVESTRVVASNLGPPGALDALVAPVEAAFAALRGGAALEVPLRTRYADDELRVARTGEREDQIFVYVRA